MATIIGLGVILIWSAGAAHLISTQIIYPVRMRAIVKRRLYKK